MADETVLVTGATGFIAGHCVEELLRHGYRVRATVRDLARSPVAYLRAAARSSGGFLDLVPARLDADPGWAEAIAGCTAVWHVASPAPKVTPRHEDEVIRPAVDGTLRVLAAAAASGTVRRVVLTSSIDAVRSGYGPAEQRTWDESHWSRLSGSDAYAKSKTMAERAAWDFAKGTDLELVAVNPGLVLGALHQPEANVSVEVIRLLLAHVLPMVPRLGFTVVDVRDVATAHRLAMEVPAAAGNRYIVAGRPLWLREIADILRAEFGPQGFRIPARPMPHWLMWAAGRFDKTVRLALPYVDIPAQVSSDKARQDLGWTARPPEESILAAAHSLVDLGVVPRPTRGGVGGGSGGRVGPE